MKEIHKLKILCYVNYIIFLSWFDKIKNMLWLQIMKKNFLQCCYYNKYM